VFDFISKTKGILRVLFLFFFENISKFPNLEFTKLNGKNLSENYTPIVNEFKLMFI